jgi:hypothetical protein
VRARVCVCVCDYLEFMDQQHCMDGGISLEEGVTFVR